MDSTSSKSAVHMTVQEFAQHLKDRKEELFNKELHGRRAGSYSNNTRRGAGSGLIKKRRHTS